MSEIITVRIKKLHEVEKDHILNVLHICGQSMSIAAKELGISRATIYRKVGRYIKNGEQLKNKGASERL